MSNYVNDVSVYGLMNKYCTTAGWEHSQIGFFKSKKRDKAVVIGSLLDDSSMYSEVSYMYLDNYANGAYKMKQVTSVIDKSMLPQCITRRSHREMFETMSKWNKLGLKHESADTIGLQPIVEMIEKWRYSKQGYKHGFQEHAGIDKAAVARYFNDKWFHDKVSLEVFYCDLHDYPIGYSMIEREASHLTDGIKEFKYLVRKCLVGSDVAMEMRNLTEAIDYMTFIDALGDDDKILVNWGCSSSGVLWYKIHKWPLYKTEDKYFLKIKRG